MLTVTASNEELQFKIRAEGFRKQDRRIYQYMDDVRKTVEHNGSRTTRELQGANYWEVVFSVRNIGEWEVAVGWVKAWAKKRFDMRNYSFFPPSSPPPPPAPPRRRASSELDELVRIGREAEKRRAKTHVLLEIQEIQLLRNSDADRWVPEHLRDKLDDADWVMNKFGWRQRRH